jgi:hypothetical protein
VQNIVLQMTQTLKFELTRRHDLTSYINVCVDKCSVNVKYVKQCIAAAVASVDKNITVVCLERIGFFVFLPVVGQKWSHREHLYSPTNLEILTKSP